MRVFWYFILTLAAKAAAVAIFPHSAAAAVLVFVSLELWLLFHLLVPNTGGLGRVRTRFASARREVWLTIDDGPDPATTPRVLDLLDRHRVRATFFLIGERVRRHPGLVREIVRRGHTVGNHTHRHPLVAFWIAGPRRVTAEIDDCAAALRAAGVSPGPWFRPPAGIKNVFLFRALAARGLTCVGWSARGRETGSFGIATPLARLKRGLCPGAILLTHEAGAPGSARLPVLAALLDHLAAENYSCVLPGADHFAAPAPARSHDAVRPQPITPRTQPVAPAKERIEMRQIV